MGIAVDFDHERDLGAEEIDDIEAEPDLAAEFEAAQLAILDNLSEAMFGLGERFARIA